MAEALTLAVVEAGLRELVDAVVDAVASPRSLTAQTMLGSAIHKVATHSASAVKGYLAAAARERDLIARLQEAERRYQGSEANLASERVTRAAAQESLVAGEEAMAAMKLRLAVAERALAAASKPGAVPA